MYNLLKYNQSKLIRIFKYPNRIKLIAKIAVVDFLSQIEKLIRFSSQQLLTIINQ